MFINDWERDLETALLFATYNGHADVASMLLAAGAPVNPVADTVSPIRGGTRRTHIRIIREGARESQISAPYCRWLDTIKSGR